MRRCDSCGNTRPLDRGKTCTAEGHFVCGSCIGTTLFGNPRLTRCPLHDKSPLR